MKICLFCLVVGMVVVGCSVNAQIQGNNHRPLNNVNTNVACDPGEVGSPCYKPTSVTVEKPSRSKMASQNRFHDVCGNPNLDCKTSGGFDDEDLPIKISGDLEWFGLYKSRPFYAVILQSRKVIVESHPNDDNYQACGGQFSADDRSAVQIIFPNNKVFSTEFGCYYHDHQYTNVKGDYNFLAIYSGTQAQARSILAKIKSTDRYRGSNIRRMQAVLCNGCH